MTGIEFAAEPHITGVANTAFGLGVTDTMTRAVERACARVADGPRPSLEAEAFIGSADPVAAAVGYASW